MKLMKFGKTLLMCALSVGVILGITSCVQSYSVGYLYVTGTVTSQSTGNGIISGFKIDHNTGKLTPIAGLPVSSGGPNPGRAVLLTGGRFLYVLNRGVNAEGGSDCTTADPCQNSKITQFSIGGNGVLAFQNTYFTQGINPFRMMSDSGGNYIYVLDHDAPDPSTCSLALGTGVNACGDITAFKIDATTGRMTTVINSQVTSAGGTPIPYFPVPANPIDFVITASYALVLSGTPATGDAVFPYSYNPSNGQLTINQNSAQPLNILQGTAIVAAGGPVYVLDNEPPNPNPTLTASQILPFTVASNGALQAAISGAIPNDPTMSSPIYLISESKGKYLYVANQGDEANSNNPASGISGFTVTQSPLTFAPIPTGGVAGTGSGPQCILEDPSNQFVYTANFNDSTVTGRLIDQNRGILADLPGTANRNYALTGPAAWCVVTGRTS